MTDRLTLRILKECARNPLNPGAWWNYLRYLVRIGADRRKTEQDRLSYGPVSVTLWLTSRCNLSCAFCHYDGELGGSGAPDRDLSFEKFEEIYRSTPEFRTALRFALYGGEPLLHPQWDRFVSFLKERGHIVSINTNGIHLERNLQKLKSVRPHFLSVSLYRENRGILERQLPGISRILPVRLSFLHAPPDLGGEGTLDAAFELARTCGVERLAIDEWSSNGRDAEVARGEGSLREVRARRGGRPGGRFGVEWALAGPDSGPTRCRFFWNSMFCDEQGRFSPCSYWRRSTHEKVDGGFWNGGRMLDLRNAMACGNPPEACQGCPALRADISGI